MQPCTHCGLPLPSGRLQYCCFGCRIADELVRPALQDEDGARPLSLWMVRLGLGLFLSINLMVFNWTFYSGEFFGEAARSGEGFQALAGLFAYLQLFLATIVVAALGLPLLGDSLHRVVQKPWRLGPDANLLITLAVFSAYGLSTWHTLRGSGSLYFDTAAMVLTLLALGNYLEARAKRKAVGGLSALDCLPRRAWVEQGGSIREVDADAIEPGDLVQVRAGEVSVVDGIVCRGSSRLDASRLTGESLKKPVAAGDSLLAGSLNLDGDLWVEARSTGPQRTIARMQQLLEEARGRLPQMHRITDRVASFFAPAVILLAVAVFIWNAWTGRWEAGLLTALSVLLISCPCALGLAAPLSCWSALERAARRGILFDSAPALERAASVRRLFFDKTGTLTRSPMQLIGISPAEGVSRRRALFLAASLEAGSLHPVAEGLLEEARRQGIDPGVPSESAILPGLGVEARFEGRRYRLGGFRLLETAAPDFSDASDGSDGSDGSDLSDLSDLSDVFLLDQERLLARFRLAERIRPEARQAVDALASLGVECEVLTGDGPAPAGRLADVLGVAVQHSLLPEAKVERLQAARRSGSGGVAMVGDGINDAPVLAAADLGIAVVGAGGLARQSGNLRLLSPSLLRVPEALAIARHTLGRIRLGLAWAFAYNSVGITLAALGLLTPVFAASSMIFSSLLIIAVSRGAGNVHAGGWGPGAGGQEFGEDSSAELAQQQEGGQSAGWASKPPAPSLQPPA